jgi:hypothetical protein
MRQAIQKTTNPVYQVAVGPGRARCRILGRPPTSKQVLS